MKVIKILTQIYRRLLDDLVPYSKSRWAFLSLMAVYVVYRILVYDFLAIMFFGGLYLLYLIVQFFTPSGLPDPDQDVFDFENPIFEESEELAHQSYNNLPEDRPLLRTITQFNLWKSIMGTLFGALISTYSTIFQIPVYWPFLFIYFVWLIGLAILKHIKHMKKYGYSPSDFSLSKTKRNVETTFI